MNTEKPDEVMTNLFLKYRHTHVKEPTNHLLSKKSIVLSVMDLSVGGGERLLRSRPLGVRGSS